jgi:glyoxylase-like metal-dependent hydrolase (beta-lactamase superfamily II)
MIIERTMHDRWLSNTWLVGDEPGGHAVIIDTGGPMAPIVERLEAERLTLTHVLCTHHHHDHVAHNGDYRARFGGAICGGAAEQEFFGDLDRELSDGDEVVSGNLHVRAVHIPGHTAGQLGFQVNDARVFTGDTLFRGSVGGTRAPGHTTFEDIHHSIMEVLMRLPPDTEVYPGHMEPTTIRREWEENPFVRYWRGIDTQAEQRCTAYGEPAVLLLTSPDYDGGTKCQVRFADGTHAVVPGSRVRAP